MVSGDMNKQELIEVATTGTGESAFGVGSAIGAIFVTVTAAMMRDETIQFVGFGSLATGTRAQCTDRNS